ncbi:MAG: 1,4-dihydroxy-2-naphthoate polyprenyltransferase [Propionibacteriaceae bacterium]|jgi:1,4-dihydroxy-2-naphthoate octaprenyltransferase|nr:1,4-dihydroxy-2-naphthoate polyprenyltransferase [Propionibacteriaceae bacterium]
MATLAEWIEGTRPRTLPAAISPVVAGSGIAWHEHSFDWLLALLALTVSLAIQIGSNLANDYSDGIRGTDADRVGPMRLVGSGATSARSVLIAGLACWALAAGAGLLIVWLTGVWWLTAVGAACILAAWGYTGGKHPYGYLGLGEVFVFVFYGLVAVGGTVFIQVGQIPASAWCAAVATGALACAILVANNLRDLEGDRKVGKLTLATRLGDNGTRLFFIGTLAVAALGVVAAAWTSSWWALLGLVMVLSLIGPVQEVFKGSVGRDLIPVLKQTGLAEFACAAGLFIGLVIAN